MRCVLIELINVTHIFLIPLQLCRECLGKADAILFAEVVLPGTVIFTLQDENNEKLILLLLVAEGKKITHTHSTTTTTKFKTDGSCYSLKKCTCVLTEGSLQALENIRQCQPGLG